MVIRYGRTRMNAIRTIARACIATKSTTTIRRSMFPDTGTARIIITVPIGSITIGTGTGLGRRDIIIPAIRIIPHRRRNIAEADEDTKFSRGRLT